VPVSVLVLVPVLVLVLVPIIVLVLVLVVVLVLALVLVLVLVLLVLAPILALVIALILLRPLCVERGGVLELVCREGCTVLGCGTLPKRRPDIVPQGRERAVSVVL
jgi:hypothetical protein